MRLVDFLVCPQPTHAHHPVFSLADLADHCLSKWTVYLPHLQYPCSSSTITSSLGVVSGALLGHPILRALTTICSYPDSDNRH